MSTWSIVVAAGSGSRFGAPKQFELLGDRRVIDWSLAAASRGADGVVVVVAASQRAALGATLETPLDDETTRLVVVDGGATRSASVRAGLAAVPASAVVIVVHDAARPLAPPELFDAVIDAVRNGADAAVPGIPVVDTIRRVEGGVVDRGALVAVQTPQGFAAGVLRAAHVANGDASDDASLVEAAGGKVVVVPGEPTNLKITTPADLVTARALLEWRSTR